MITPINTTVMRDIHVVPNGRSWKVTMEGHDAPLRHVATKQEAVYYGQQLAKEAGLLLVIHAKDGTFQDVRNYKPQIPVL